MATTSSTGLSIPTSGDSPNIPADLLTLAGDLDTATVPLFASTSARDTAYALAPFGLCFVGASVDSATLYRRRGGQWREMADLDAIIGSPVTSGVSISAAANWKDFSYEFINRAGLILATIQGTYTGPDVTANSFGNLGNITAATIPAPWRPIGSGVVLTLACRDANDDHQWLGGVTGAGNLYIFAGMPNAVFVGNREITWQFVYAG